MGQNITLKVAGREYPLVAKTPTQEQTMRLAAQEVNSLLDKYNQLYPNRSLEDKLAFVALNSTMGKISEHRKLELIQEEVLALKNDTDSYLEGK